MKNANQSMGELVVYEPPRKPIGRPTLYTPELGKRICDLIAHSARGLEYLMSLEDDLPEPRTVYRWLNDHADFCQRYLRAKEAKADHLFDECVEIADDSSEDYKVVFTRQGPVRVFDAEHVQRSKLRVETRLRVAGKLNPKKYGDVLKLTGADGGPIQLEAVRERIAGKIDSLAVTQGAGETVEQPDAGGAKRARGGRRRRDQK